MVDRLSPLDVSFLYMETPTTAMHVGGVLTFEQPPGGLGYDQLLALIGDRLALVPRYRQKLRWVPGRLANPVWVDDENFDLTYHVRRSALPRPGTDAQLRELVGRLQSRQLDRSRPLWELYLIEGLADNRVGMVTKTHHAMVDGVAAVDLGTVLFDLTTTPREVLHDPWRPSPPPTRATLVAGAVVDAVRRPSQLLDTARVALTDVQLTARRVTSVAGSVVASVHTFVRPAAPSPLNVRIGAQRRFAMASTELADYKRIRLAHGGTVNDVVLAAVAGGLRSWLVTRGEPVDAASTIRAMVPVSIRSDESRGEMGNRVSSYFVDLPVGEVDPVARLHAVTTAMAAHKANEEAVGADALVQLAGFAPPTMALLGARAASAMTRHLFNVVVTNVPGPQFALYAAGAKMLQMYPVVPLAKGQAVAIGLTSYNGGVFYGLNADRDAMPDVDVLAECLERAVAELAETVGR